MESRYKSVPAFLNGLNDAVFGLFNTMHNAFIPTAKLQSVFQE
jgi:hypothetical protein